MDISNFVSYRLGFIDKNLFYQMRNCLKNLQAQIAKKYKYKVVGRCIKKDKKNIDSNLRFIATKGLVKCSFIKFHLIKIFKLLMTI